MALPHHTGQVTRVRDESRALLEIADLLDLICRTREEADLSTLADEPQVRRELFALIDTPGQEIWERVRELALYPSNFPGLETPSPLGITVGDLAYAFGLGDLECPTRDQLIEILRWGQHEYGDPTLNGHILA